MKKILILSVLPLAVSSALAAPTFSFNPSSVTADTATDIQIIYNQDNTDPGTTYALQIKPPAGVTIGTITPGIGFICQLNTAGNIAVGITTTNALPDGHSPCTFSATVPASLTSATFSIEQAQHVLESGTIIKTEDGTLTIPGDQPELSLTVGGGSGSFNTTVNYSVGTGTGTGTFTCDSGATGATVAGGTAVSCTATPNGSDTSAITGCPAGATTSNDTTCAFTASTTADETVDLVATFTAGGGTGPGTGPGTNPSTPGSARPVPALGVFGLLAMLASMFGAATMVLRRKR